VHTVPARATGTPRQGAEPVQTTTPTASRMETFDGSTQ
jgi:hypothetical protein